ncbi:macrophage mannose receptor 1-like [Polyodon spathula]|uniref:macrophage mannose receptor 1-like n=1 Tax=Polyodon spathula TaxID=7913 RepID=UPI001B7DEC1D|nr:macrophage mannose receptor 1-like [Polyodon spathula]
MGVVFLSCVLVIWLAKPSRFCVPADNQIRKHVFVNTLKSWSEAQSYCRENHTDLATVRSQEEAKQLFSIPGVSLIADAWIGLYRDDTQNWQWSNGYNVIYKNWTENLFCVSINSDGQWEDRVCGEMSAFMCYQETSNITERYTLIQELKTWTEAQQYCREHHTDLVSIKNTSENEDLVKKAQGVPFWIGLFNEPWKWSHQGDNYTFHYWKNGEPDNCEGRQRCVRMYKSGEWGDKECDLLYPFFCYDDATPSDPPSTPLSEDATPSDPPSTPLSEGSGEYNYYSGTEDSGSGSGEYNYYSGTEDSGPDKMETLRIQLNAPAELNLEDPKVSEALLEQILEHFSNNFPMDGVKLRWRKRDGQIFHKDNKEAEEGEGEEEEEMCSEP